MSCSDVMTCFDNDLLTDDCDDALIWEQDFNPLAEGGTEKENDTISVWSTYDDNRHYRYA